VKVTQSEQAQRQAVLTIELEPREVEPYLERAYRRVVQRLVVPGFRKGRAPRPLVERMVGRDYLLSEALESLAPEVADRAVREQGLEPYALPRVEVVSLEPLVLRAVVPLPPGVEVDDYRSVRVKPEPAEVTEAQVERVLEDLRRRRGTWEPVERPVQMGDLVTLSVRGVVDGETVLDQRDVDLLADEDWPYPLPGFARHLEGMRRGEIQEFDLPFPEDYPDPNYRGKTCRFTVLLKEVKARRLPDLDDEFAKEMGAESLEGLRRRIREGLQAEAERVARQRTRAQVLRAVLERAQVELPPLLVERETEALLEEEVNALRRRGIALQDYLTRIGQTEEEFRRRAEERAVARLKEDLVLQRIAEQEGFTVEEAEVEEEIQRLAEEAGAQADRVRDLFASPAGRTYLRKRLLLEKTLAFLVDLATRPAEEPAGGEGTPGQENQASKEEGNEGTDG